MKKKTFLYLCVAFGIVSASCFDSQEKGTDWKKKCIGCSRLPAEKARLKNWRIPHCCHVLYGSVTNWTFL